MLEKLSLENKKILFDELGEDEIKKTKKEIAQIKKKIQRIGNQQASRKGLSIERIRTFAMLLTQKANRIEHLKQLKGLQEVITR